MLTAAGHTLAIVPARATDDAAKNGVQAPAIAAPKPLDMALVDKTVEYASTLTRLHALIVAHHGKPIVERVFRGPGLDRVVNV